MEIKDITHYKNIFGIYLLQVLEFSVIRHQLKELTILVVLPKNVLLYDTVLKMFPLVNIEKTLKVIEK